MLSYAVQALKDADVVDRLIVSTDSEEYADVARRYGADVPFLRPAELASDRRTLIEVMGHLLETFDSMGEHFDAVLSCQATVPLIRAETIRSVVDKFHTTGCEAVATVSTIRQGHPYLAKRLTGPDGDIAKPMFTLPEETAAYPRQARPDAYFFNGAIFLRDRSLLSTPDPATNALGLAPRTVEMDSIEATNIDEPLDFFIAEHLIQCGGKV